ncbi:MAG TPA: zinc ribbon domain-containing protein [Candidatus Melainabacteria bacterium]|jgi:DNA-directed RNA polymerase subunit M/transcription elongation factor TFIIS|nr:zinc ribbon domain-containing protein [Candidatus Melainabacteria bacterium]HIN66713.1 zinc ribbon domain-containing protein [Candidatus Obscuribacterales bacterium]
MSRSANTTTNCPACKKQNDGAMHFCIFCGTVLNPAKAKRADRTCVSCGRFDELNDTFCIHCGANTSQGVSRDSIEIGSLREAKHTPVLATTRPSAAQSVTRNRVKAVSAQVAQDRMRSQDKTGKKPGNSVIWACAGAVVGLVLAGLAFQSGALVHAARFCLPSQGLAIYTEVPWMTVLIENLEGKDFIIGETGPKGTLVVDNLLPGKSYRLRMEGHGFETVYFAPFEFDKTRASILGYPKKISLPPRHI